MKKVLIAFLTVLMLITFVSCNDKNDKALEEAEKREQATIDFSNFAVDSSAQKIPNYIG